MKDKLYIKNIPFKEYINSEEIYRYNHYMKYGVFESVDHFNIGSLMNDYTFGAVKDVQFDEKSEGLNFISLLKILKYLINVDSKRFGNTPIFNLNEARLYLINQVAIINSFESDNLGHLPTPEEKQADIKRFAKFETFPQFDLIAGGDLLKFEEVKKMPYMICFTKLFYESSKASYRDDLNRIVANKNKK